MMHEEVIRFRRQAEHCRRLALGVSDERTIAALLEMALEYDQKADWLKRNAASSG
jgi:hypothetical protein